jgi:hypothetical protein
MRRRNQRADITINPMPGVGNQFGWQTHQAIQSWTASVDVKSSIVVVIETAVAGAATKALITNQGELHSAVGLQLATAICAMTALVLAVACALWVVFPRLERNRTSTLAPTGLVYFGHVRARRPADIAAALAKMTPEEERLQLAQQLHMTGKVAWRKHAWLQASLSLFAMGSALLVLAFVAF